MNNLHNIIDNEDRLHASINYIIATVFIIILTVVIMQLALVGYICYYIASNASVIIDSIGSTSHDMFILLESNTSDPYSYLFNNHRH